MREVKLAKVILSLLHTVTKTDELQCSESERMCACACVCVVYLCLEGQPCQPVWQQGTESKPALVELLCCLSNVISTTPLWRSRQNNEEGVTQSNTHWYILQSSQSYNSSPCRGQINTPFMHTESAQCYWRWDESRSKLQSEFIQLYTDSFSSKWHLLNANGQFDV